MASFASSATTGGARKHAWTNSIQYIKTLGHCLQNYNKLIQSRRDAEG